MRAVVIGGGLAGLAAALDLLDAGHAVTLLESRPTLGGAVQTLPEREGDPAPPPDNGQHVALGCCSEYVRFLERVGQASSLRRLRLNMPVIGEDGRVQRLGAGAFALLRYGHLSLGERLRVAHVARRLGRLEPLDHDDETFAGLLRRLGSSQAAIDRFWDVFMRPALNLPSEEASAALGIFTVQDGTARGLGRKRSLAPGRSTRRDARRRGRTGSRGRRLDGSATRPRDRARW